MLQSLKQQCCSACCLWFRGDPIPSFLMYNAINIPKEPDLVIFADDTAMFQKHKHAQAMFTKLPNYLNRILA